MPQPTWITPAGSLGVIAEGIFYSVPIEATAGTDPVYFRLLAGSLPQGIQVTSDGFIKGVPLQVNQDVTSRFAIRAYTTKEIGGQTLIDRLSDRTFTITVSGSDDPEFITPAGNVGTYYDGTEASIQIDVSDTDPSDEVVISLIGGELPPGLTLDSRTGLISGVILPLNPLDGSAKPNYGMSRYDEYPFDFSSRSASRNFQFTLKASTGFTSTVRTFEIYVYSKASMTADTTSITADNTFVTADVTPDRPPVVLTKEGYIGKYRADNYFAYKFDAIDFDGEPIEYSLYSGFIPPGLQLDPNTGWLYGYLPDQGATEISYDFSIKVNQKVELATPWNQFIPYEANDIVSYLGKNYQALSAVSSGVPLTNGSYWYWLQMPTSRPYSYSITIIGNIDTEITWLTPSDLGSIDNGSISLLTIKATSTTNRTIEYRLKPGEGSIGNYVPGFYNKLPQGLKLLPSGNISGRVSFNTFSIDNGFTTFDKKTTTFDSRFTFTVEAYSQDGLISVFKTFTILVNRAFNEPYENLYIQAMPPENDRDLINSLLLNQDLISPSFLYRADDPYFGASRNVIYMHAYGLPSSTLEDYVRALELNHYRKQLVLGEIKVAQARLNNTGEVLYEVVYSEIQDSGVNEKGQSPGQSVPVPYPFDDPNDGSSLITEVYPNSLIEMRDQVIDTVGEYAKVLPLWMTSKQSNGRVLGFTRAFIIAYCKPDKGEQMAYNIRTKWGERLNMVDFIADRYILDRQYSRNWDPIADSGGGQWVPHPAQATTFDILPYYALASNLVGSGYQANDKLRIPGSSLGGIDGINDIDITIITVDGLGRIETLIYNGFVASGVEINTQFNGVSAVNVDSFGLGATFNIIVLDIAGTTTFDGGSTEFIVPTDSYGLTDQYNAYLLYPKVNILNGPPTPPPPPPVFT